MAAVMRIILAVSFAGFCLLAGGALAERQPRHMLDRPKLVHNALDAPVYPVCSVGGRQAACLRSEACTSQGGRFTGFCAGDPTLVCCVVEKTCDDETSAHSVTFRNPSFPLENLRPRLCPLMIKVGRDICSMRVDMNVFELEPATKSGCIFDMFVILGTVEGPTASLCGNMTGFATTFAVKELSDVTLSLVAQGRHKFSITATQFACAAVPPFVSPSSAGLRIRDPPKYVPVSTTTPAPHVRGSTFTGDSEAPYDTVDVTPMSQFFQGFYAREKAMPATRCADQEENISFVPRIVDGVYANIHEYPWQVALFHIKPGKNKSKSAFFCGASLISDSFVLTAAHCVLGSSMRADRIRAILGDHDLSTRKETDSTYRDIRRIIFNVHYRADTVRNDIALLQLKKPVKFSSSINPVLLPWALDDTFEGLNATVTGWGRDKIGKRISSYVLKEYSSSLLTEDTCDRQWSTKSTLKPQLSTDPKKQICLDVSKGSPCHGDSGGPLVVCSGEVCTQVGVVSFGFPLCKNVGLPAVFTRLTYYRPWLDINMASANAMPV